LLEEFNSLSVIFGESSERFVKTEITVDEEQSVAEAEAQRYRQEQEEYYKQQEEAYAQEFTNQRDDSIQLDPSAQLDPKNFETFWKTWPATPDNKVEGPVVLTTPDLPTLEAAFTNNYLSTVAKGASGAVLRFFLYTFESTHQAWILAELQINTQTLTAVATVKSSSPEAFALFKPYFLAVLKLL